ncbi:O-antigen/teichoic acid export membrane protein [Desulfomicrobium macestii]|uniref:O-antigen/teichoic acid export membrane protein n=1 Tax=Desulfomicrobium macestii TaxID=90731 RepID=A0ABR9H6Q2_9BACT|nr:oligosaccharide flippase family protein [Desulfomicrobium macestii]MBE1426385.1 O-antigen/teichoic acid export membrane protein [Desulfomicrobium macestii]
MALKRNLVANYLGQGWAALMGLAFVPYYIKLLGIEAYGLIGLFAVLQAWLSLLDMGMTPTLGREMARFTAGTHSNESIRDLLRSIEIIAVVVAVLIAGGVALGSDWIATSWLKAEALPSEMVAQVFTIMGLVTALRFVEGVYRSAIVGLQRHVLFNVVNSVMATLRGLGALGILVWVSPTIGAFFLWQGGVSLVTLALLFATTYASIPEGERKGRFSLDALRCVWRFAGGMVGITILALLLTQVDKILLSKLLTLREFGHYTLAGAVAGALSMLIGPIFQAFYPRFCELQAHGDTLALADSYHKGAQLVSVIAGSAAIVLIYYAETFLLLWTQDAELSENVAVLLSLLIFGNLLNGLLGIPYQMQLAHGWLRLAIYVNSVAVLFIIPAILWVVPRYGALGAAWIWVALNAGYGLIAAQFLYRRIMKAEKWRWYKEDVLTPLLVATFAVGIVKILWPAPETLSAQVLVLAFASSLALGLSGLAANRVRQEVRSIVGSVLDKFNRKLMFFK